MTSEERISELAEILAVGLIRIVAPKSSPIAAQTEDISLDFSAGESGHPTPVNGRISDA